MSLFIFFSRACILLEEQDHERCEGTIVNVVTGHKHAINPYKCELIVKEKYLGQPESVKRDSFVIINQKCLYLSSSAELVFFSRNKIMSGVKGLS